MTASDDHRHVSNEDYGARIGILSQRTTNLESQFADLRRDINHQMNGVNSAVVNLSGKRRALPSARRIACRTFRPQWQAVGVALTFAAMIGALAYWPIREATKDLKDGLSAMSQRIVTRQELEMFMQRTNENTDRNEARIEKVDDKLIPRSEFELGMKAMEQRLEFQQNLSTRIQKRLAEVGPRALSIPAEQNEQFPSHRGNHSRECKGPCRFYQPAGAFYVSIPPTPSADERSPAITPTWRRRDGRACILVGATNPRKLRQLWPFRLGYYRCNGPPLPSFSLSRHLCQMPIA